MKNSPKIRFKCPSCNATMSVSGSETGRKGACPKCGQPLQVPRDQPAVQPSDRSEVHGSPPQILSAESTWKTQAPTSRRLPSFALGAVCGLLVGLAFGTVCTLTVVGASGPRENPPKGNAGPAAESQVGKAGMPKEDSGQSKAAGMTRAEFRKKENELIQAKRGIGKLKVKDLYDVFGQPARKQTIDRATRWYWQCKDGLIEMKFADLGSPHLDNDTDAVLIMGVNDI